MALDASRRALLERSRAEGLLRSCFDLDPAALEITTAPFGVAATDGTKAWIVSMSKDLAVLGGALVWIDRALPAEVHFVVDHHPGIHARRVAVLAPECRVWHAEGTTITEAAAEAIAEPLPRPDDTAAIEAALVEIGLDVICEDGIVRGEIAGLEVARILHGPDGAVLEAGVGRFDREAGALLHAGRPPVDAVIDAAALVRPHRTVGAASHGINRMARERWLRATIIGDPSIAEIAFPELVEPIPPRANLLEVVPAALLGTDGDRRVLVVCSVGVDLGLVPAIADLLVVHQPDEVRILVPERDRLPHLERLAGRIPLPCSIRSIATPWVD